MRVEKRWHRSLLSLCIAACLTFSQALPAAAASEEVRSLLSTALTLVDSDFDNNQGTILILLQNCLSASEGDAALSSIVSSIAVLLESGSADPASVKALLQAAIDSSASAGPADEATGEEAPAADPAAAPAEEEAPAAEQAADPAIQESSAEEAAVQISEPETAAAEQQEQPEAAEAGGEFEPVITKETNAQPQYSDTGLPIFEVASYIKTLLQESVIVAVPQAWGNNGTGKALTTYSPVNASGAISPAAGTLSITYFPMEDDTPAEAFDSYVKSISDMSVVAGVTTEDTFAADLPARKLDFMMNVGANQFSCETVCFAYEDTVYAIELMQGHQTAYDYFPVYDEVVESAEIGEADEIAAILSWEEAPETETMPPAQEETAPAATEAPAAVQEETAPAATEAPAAVQEETAPAATEAPAAVQEETAPAATEAPAAVQEETAPAATEAPADTQEETGSGLVRHEVTLQSEGDGTGGSSGGSGTGAAEAAPVNPDLPSDMGTFKYELNGQVYQFPTGISELQADTLQLDRTLQIPYDFSSDADMTEGSWTELVNTQYYYFENAFYKEMAGVTNMKGYPVPMSECMLTALIDTQGSYVDITLPGGIRVGSPETDIIKGFPEFAGRAMDGLAGFRENELLYACNVRDDGCHGYVLVRNDDPYYSAVSIICDKGVVIEISFECIGSVRATGVFL